MRTKSRKERGKWKKNNEEKEAKRISRKRLLITIFRWETREGGERNLSTKSKVSVGKKKKAFL